MTAIAQRLEPDRGRMTEWFEHMHRHPELSMRETGTADYIAGLLRGFGGWEVATGVGGNGVVASLQVGDGDGAIGLRADFDALPIRERNDLPYRKPRGWPMCAATTATPPCCWAPPGIWRRPAISTEPSA